MAAKATTGGVSNQIVDPDYIAPPGVAPETALELGVPDAGLPEDEDERERALEARADARADAQSQPAASDDPGRNAEGTAEQEEEPSPGKTSSPESKKPARSTSAPKKNAATPSNAPSTNGRSNERPRGSSTASTEDTSSRLADKG